MLQDTNKRLQEYNTNYLFVIDPSSGNADEKSVMSLHCGTIKLVLEVLKSTLNTLFDGWDLSIDVLMPTQRHFDMHTPMQRV
jgi:hypothetical protein